MLPELLQMRVLACTILLIFHSAVTTTFLLAEQGAEQGQELIGTPAADFSVSEWLNTKPITIKQLRGHVLLVRFWTDTCPYCRRSAPALRTLHERYHNKGLQVIGIFHPKPAGKVTTARVKKAVATLAFSFPIGIDPTWATLENWWLKHTPRGWTSVSFVIDKKGIIRHIHPGGEYYQDSSNPRSLAHRDYQKLVHVIEDLLSENTPQGR